MYFSNAAVDLVYAFSGRHHFDDETFVMGRDLITAGQQSAPPTGPLVRTSARLFPPPAAGELHKKSPGYWLWGAWW